MPAGITVGVDGSDHSRHALAWALREAVLRDQPLTVITVRPAPVRPATDIFWAVPAGPETSPGMELERKAAREFTDQVVSGIGGKVPELTVTVVTGDPAEELVRASRDTGLLVVGARGGGGFGKLLLGSVSSKVVHHAVCPVVVVPPAR